MRGRVGKRRRGERDKGVGGGVWERGSKENAEHLYLTILSSCSAMRGPRDRQLRAEPSMPWSTVRGAALVARPKARKDSFTAL